MLNSELITTSVWVKLRDDKYTLLFESPNTTRDFLLSIPNDFNTCKKSLVFGASKLKSSTTTIDFSPAFIDKADLRAKRFTLSLSLSVCLCVCVSVTLSVPLSLSLSLSACVCVRERERETVCVLLPLFTFFFLLLSLSLSPFSF